jgi:hypothetical protein
MAEVVSNCTKKFFGLEEAPLDEKIRESLKSPRVSRLA